MSFTRLIIPGAPPTFHTPNDGSRAEPGNEAILTQARIQLCVSHTDSNRCNGIWNGMVEWKMEWNGECT